MLRTIWGDNERYLSTYWEKFQGRFYVAGDSAHRDKPTAITGSWAASTMC